VQGLRFVLLAYCATDDILMDNASIMVDIKMRADALQCLLLSFMGTSVGELDICCRRSGFDGMYTLPDFRMRPSVTLHAGSLRPAMMLFRRADNSVSALTALLISS
jgi:hypothetical protein